jgi:hypothetical protein
MVPFVGLGERYVEGLIVRGRAEKSASPVLDAAYSALGAPFGVFKAFHRGHASKGEVRDFLTMLSLSTGFPVTPIGRGIDAYERFSGDKIYRRK